MTIPLRTYYLIFLDYLTSIISWFLFYYFRKTLIENTTFEISNSFFLGMVVVPFFWLFIYMLQGTYLDVKRLYRFKTFNLTTQATFIGSLILFFTLLIDDSIIGYYVYYKSIALLIIIHFFLTFIPRIIFISVQVHQIQSRKDGFKNDFVGWK
jgi:hypothetical protein